MNPIHQKRLNIFIAFLVIVSFAAGVHGWYTYYVNNGMEIDIPTSMFLSLQLFTLGNGFEDIHIPLTLNIARFIAPFSLAGAIISALVSNTSRSLLSLKIKLLYRNHIIIVGLNANSLILARNLSNNSDKPKVLIIDPEPDLALWEMALQQNTSILQKDFYSSRILQDAGIKKASLLLLNASDDANISILNSPVLKNMALTVIVEIADQFTFQQLKDIPSSKFGKANVHFTNLNLLIASQITDEFSPDHFEPISADTKSIHVVFAGDNPIIHPLIDECGRIYHFANLQKPFFTIISNNADAFSRELLNRQPLFAEVAQIDCHNLHSYRNITVPDSYPDTSLCFVVFNNLAEGIQMAERLRQLFYARNHSLQKPQIILINPDDNNILSMVPGFEENLKNLNIHHICTGQYLSKEVVVENREKYDIIAKFINSQFSSEILNNLEDVNELWNNLSPSEKDYNRFPARHYHIKLRTMGAAIVPQSDPREAFNLESVSDDMRLLLARMEKNRWNAEKFLTGFVPGQYNDDKNLEKFLKKELKYHPALKTWEQISQEEKVKDFFAFNNIREILAQAGLKIVKEET